MATSTMIRLELPGIKLSTVETTPVDTQIECMANQLNFGAVISADANSFCDPDGVGEPFFEIAAGTSIDWLNLMLDNAKTYMTAEITFNRDATSPTATNWIWSGLVWVPVLATVLNSAVKGYTRETVRFESRGEAWQVDKGSGPVDIAGWTTPPA